MNIYLDFDGTIVEHDYPRIGSPNPQALEVVKKLQDAGHRIILNSLRAEFPDNSSKEALDFLNTNKSVPGIKVSQQTAQKIYPPGWDLDRIEKDIYIDDIAPGIPLIAAPNTGGFMVDWLEIERQLVEKGILDEKD